ncbi:hypothetical protein [Tenacibaculum finnmarkense]|uniref:hypothetical protein n=1 Tax=Tenacibaculum finnmarkense TaxID=2781243 RepID=UPI001E47198A|nr:hypothetical protein [Tenacibaculum finnmarkense]MCD8408523.1 hypothetical protein [Tenacibaculum dicentrarchi]MCD8423667.1 hypothetical protein [Tenacibaculum finnmarkense genomovar ulcerans]MCG8239823.1 hypothetical protein [Tenacibaculum finnmarkense genomovar ulcerans]
MKLNILIILLTFVSCIGQCPSELNLGEFKLSKKSKNIFPYQNNEKQLIFKDSLGNKVIYDIMKPRNYKEIVKWNKICKHSIEKKILIKATKELLEIYLETNSDSFQSIKIELSTELNLNKAQKLDEYDCMWFFRGGGGTPGIVTDIKNSNPTHISKNIEEIVINGNQYKNLLEIKSFKINTFYYDLEKGIIAINEYRDYRKPKYWVLDSVVYNGEIIGEKKQKL